MANRKRARKQNNVESEYYVDDTCIDCGTCYWMAPDTFKREGYQSIAYSKIENEQQQMSAQNALLSCPTNSIGAATQMRPSPTLPSLISENVYHLGFHSERSFGGTPYYINDYGGVMIDCPRFNQKTIQHLRERQGLKLQLLTHKDGIADTGQYHREFNTTRIIHIGDQCNKAMNWERYLSGEDDIEIEQNLLAIPTPGHTKGSVCYLYQHKYLFTGDHLCFSRNLGHLIGFKNHCWYSNEKLITSMEKLLNYDFEWILPEHGAPYHASPDKMKNEIETCLNYLKS